MIADKLLGWPVPESEDHFHIVLRNGDSQIELNILFPEDKETLDLMEATLFNLRYWLDSGKRRHEALRTKVEDTWVGP